MFIFVSTFLPHQPPTHHVQHPFTTPLNYSLLPKTSSLSCLSFCATIWCSASSQKRLKKRDHYLTYIRITNDNKKKCWQCFLSEIFSSPDMPNHHLSPCNSGTTVSKIAGQQARIVKGLERTATHLSLCT